MISAPPESCLEGQARVNFTLDHPVLPVCYKALLCSWEDGTRSVESSEKYGCVLGNVNMTTDYELIF